MAVPLFDGVPIFGAICVVRTDGFSRGQQITATFGLDGLGAQDAGDRGGTTVIVGTLVGDGLTGLAAAEALIRSYADGQPHTLTDSTGTTWQDVILRTYQPLGRLRQTPDYHLLRDYKCTLLHLSRY